MKQRVGRRGEDIAAAFLMLKGFKILARNWRCRMGEIDIIAERQGTVHFVEVKYRQNTMFGFPEEAITRTKLQHLARAMEMWLRVQKRPIKNYQTDAIAILQKPNMPPDIRWIEGI